MRALLQLVITQHNTQDRLSTRLQLRGGEQSFGGVA
jgi:hypothetical protein